MKFNNDMLVSTAMLACTAAATPISYAQTTMPMPTITQVAALPSASAVCVPGYRLYPECMRHGHKPAVCVPGYALYPECMRHSRPAVKVSLDVVNDTAALNTTAAHLEARMRLPVCLEESRHGKPGHGRNDAEDSGYAKSHARHSCREIAPLRTGRVEARATAWNKTMITHVTETLPLNQTTVVDAIETPKELPMNNTISIDNTETSEEVPLDETSTVDDTETLEETPEHETITVEDTETVQKLPVCVSGPDHESTRNRSDCYEIPHYIPAYRESKWEKIVDKTTSIAMKGLMTVAPFIPMMIPRSFNHGINHLPGHGIPHLAIGFNSSFFPHHLDLKNNTIEKHIIMDEKHIVIHGKNIATEEKHTTIDGKNITTDEITTIEARRIPCQPGNPHHFPGCENPPKKGGPIGLNGSPLLHHPEITNLTVEDRRLHCEAGNSHHLPACESHNRPSPWLSRPAVRNATHGNNSDLEGYAGTHSQAQTTRSTISDQVPAVTVVARDFMAQTTLPVVHRPSPIVVSPQSFLTVYIQDFAAQTTLPAPISAPTYTPAQISQYMHPRRAFWDKWLIHF